MKRELTTKHPGGFKETWPGQYKLFSWMEYVTAIPQPIFIITTLKGNNMPNACLHAWATFAGEAESYYTIITILKSTHTYVNILRCREYCMNFPDYTYIDQARKTIENNTEETDEITQAGFAIEKAGVIGVPRIRECFLNMECVLEWEKDLFPGSLWGLLCGKVVHMAMEEARLKSGFFGRYGGSGYMYNIHSPKNPLDGTSCEDKIGKIEIVN